MTITGNTEPASDYNTHSYVILKIKGIVEIVDYFKTFSRQHYFYHNMTVLYILLIGHSFLIHILSFSKEGMCSF